MIERISTGHHELDTVLDFLRLGDNVVWQVDSIDQYRKYLKPFISKSLEEKRKILYIRFGSHSELIDTVKLADQVSVLRPQSNQGFEHFASEVYRIVTEAGREAFYVFDCLSDLLDQWSSDLMIGNFFRITCPYLFELDTIAYFALLRGQHSFDTIARIRETTQLLLDLYQIDGRDYIHPLKVWQRYAPTMFLPHRLSDSTCAPITSSAQAAVLFAAVQTRQQQTQRQIDYWDRLCLNAEEAIGGKNQADISRRLTDLLIGDQGRIGDLINTWFSLEDLVAISKRLIGTGKIGGKAAGMLLARKIAGDILSDDGAARMEPHDSYYLGSDLFYTYVVHNGWWKLRMDQKSDTGYFTGAAALSEYLLTGSFPAAIREKFQQMLEYFGQSPIIVRSSSLLEDNFGNAFAGKYESVFCSNQGSPQDRFDAFEQAVRQVYASMLSTEALTYRKQRGLDQKDEQMALLVQRVSGSYHNYYYYPWLAGVGHSRNLYVFSDRLDPDAGALRLVYGLGTRAVNRVEGDYPRLVALDQPLLSPHADRDEARLYSQRYVDLIDLKNNSFQTIELEQVDQETRDPDLQLIADIDWDSDRQLTELGIRHNPPKIINFRKLFNNRALTDTFYKIMKKLEEAYDYPVDIEFTINRGEQDQFLINLLQCRPLQTRRSGKAVDFFNTAKPESVVLNSKGSFIGGNSCFTIRTVVSINPVKYASLKESERYQIARIIGRLNQEFADSSRSSGASMLIGPGRWGTTTPSLGIPVGFSEICNFNVLAETTLESAGMIPEISFGSHFFLDLIETDIFYLAVMPAHESDFKSERLLSSHNLLPDLLPEAGDWTSVIHVSDFSSQRLTLFSDVSRQELLLAFV